MSGSIIHNLQNCFPSLGSFPSPWTVYPDFDSCYSHFMPYRMTPSVRHRAIEVHYYYYYNIIVPRLCSIHDVINGSSLPCYDDLFLHEMVVLLVHIEISLFLLHSLDGATIYLALCTVYIANTSCTIQSTNSISTPELQPLFSAALVPTCYTPEGYAPCSDHTP